MLKPLLDRVIVKMIEEEECTKSGIIIGGSSKESSHVAEVISVGLGKVIDGKTEKIGINKGDRVVINKYSGTEIKYEGEEYIILKQEDILAIVE